MNNEYEKVKNAYLQFLKNDGYLLENDVNERSITHKFAVYLENEFSEWDVDCEYNRNGIDKKTLIGLKEKIDSDNLVGSTVYPDIIIHHRGSHDNYIVIEVKKDYYTEKKNAHDEKKLKLYKEQLGYKHAYFIKFPTKENFKNLELKKLDECNYIELKFQTEDVRR